MKFLKNQGFVLILAAVAVILVGKNLLWPILKPKFASAPATKVSPANNPPAPAAAPPAPANSTAYSQVATAAAAAIAKLGDALNAARNQRPATNAAPKGEKMNAQALKAQSQAWVSSPQRDPFKKRNATGEKSARELLTLTGVLRQTDSDLAVINNRVIAIGETILGFRVEKVEPNRVWLSGPNGIESIEFKYFVQMPEPVEPPPAADPINATPQPSPQQTRQASRTRAKEADAVAAGSPGFNAEEENEEWIEGVMERAEYLRLDGEAPFSISLFDAGDSLLWSPLSNITLIETFDAPAPDHFFNKDENEGTDADQLPH